MTVWAVAVLVLLLVVVAYVVVVGDGTYFGSGFVRWLYDRLASRWRYPDDPRLRAADRDHLLPLIRRELADVNNPRVLDVATGTGRIPLLLVRDATSWFNGSVVGLDPSTGMLKRAREKLLAGPPSPSVEFVEGWAEELDWPEGTFDLVTCFEAFHNFGQPRRALAEMCRVLRPGGVLIVNKIGDFHARLVPGKALTRKGFARELGRIGMEQLRFDRYQRRLGPVELVIAAKPAVDGIRPPRRHGAAGRSIDSRDRGILRTNEGEERN